MPTRSVNSVFFLVCLLFSLQVKADLPVHCLKHQIVGTWNLLLTVPLTSDPSERVTCEHDSPDSPRTSHLAMKDNFNADKTITLELKNDDSVHEKSKSSGGGYSTWTMIYDEGFEIRHNGVRYFSFSEYVQTGSGFKSKCSETLVGWYHNYNNDQKGCFKAQKVGADKDLTQNIKQAYVVEPDYVQVKEKTGKSHKYHQKASNEDKFDNFLHKKEENNEMINFRQNDVNLQQRITERLNKNVNKKWVAAVHHKFSGLSLTQLNMMAGRKKNGIVITDNSSFNRFSSFVEMDTNRNYNRDVSDLPKSFNWLDSLKAPRSQGDCGSCYVFATLAMLQARLKIHYDEDVVLSVQHSINCNFYNQGCDGGYPFLVEKYANEYGLVDDKCAKYEASNGRCSDVCDIDSLDKIYHVKDYRFVGGSYGKSNEREMMLELQKNGPIVVSFEPSYDFMYYSSGIYHSVDAADWILNGEDKPEWEKVDHSVLCYGWGVTEDGEKYWMLQNTWGNDWGEGGFFRMRRGTDESHIESLAEAADPVIKKNSNIFLNRRSNSKIFLEN